MRLSGIVLLLVGLACQDPVPRLDNMHLLDVQFRPDATTLHKNDTLRGTLVLHNRSDQDIHCIFGSFPYHSLRFYDLWGGELSEWPRFRFSVMTEFTLEPGEHTICRVKWRLDGSDGPDPAVGLHRIGVGLHEHPGLETRLWLRVLK